MYQAKDCLHNPPFDICAHLKSDLTFTLLPRQEIHNLGGTLPCFLSLSVNVLSHSHHLFPLGMGLLPYHCRVAFFLRGSLPLSSGSCKQTPLIFQCNFLWKSMVLRLLHSQ